MARKLLIESDPYEIRAAVLDGERAVEIAIERRRARGLVGNIYRGRVSRVLPGIQAAFVDIGLERNAFLYANDVRDPLAEVGELVGEDEQWEPLARDAQRPIADLLEPGQELLVQVRKDPLPRKGARVTTQLALPGRYLVLLTTSRDRGISRRIEDPEERQRLLDALDRLGPVPGGIIVRTAGEGREADELGRDLDHLARLWNGIAERAEAVEAPALVHSEVDLAQRIVRDRLDPTVEVVWVDGAETLDRVRAEAEALDPELAKRVRGYSEPGRLFAHFGLDRQIGKALERRIWLPSGGYLLIQQTEALVVVDVNTGRYLGSKNLEETVVATNLEAVEEIARQLQLRDLGGIIVVDFIDMVESANRDRVYLALEERLREDRAKTSISRVSEFGLVEITRKRSRPNLRRTLSRACPCCRGDGWVRSPETVALELRRRLLGQAERHRGGDLCLRVHPDVAEVLAGDYSAVVDELAEALAATVTVEADAALHPERYELRAAPAVHAPS